MPLSFLTADQDTFLAEAAAILDAGEFRPGAFAVGVTADPDAFAPDGYVVFQNLDPSGVDLHLAMRPHLMRRRDLYRGICKMAFLRGRGLDAACLRVFIREENTVAQVAALKAGFAFQVRLSAGIADRHAVVLMTMARDACPWLLPEPPHVKEEPDGR